MLKKIINAAMISLVLLFIVTSSRVSAQNKVKIDNFTLKDQNSKNYSLSDFKNSKALVIMFIATRCPVSNAYNSRMVSLFDDYKDKGVDFLAINSNKQEDVDEIEKHAKENGFDFPVLKDQENVIADRFKASVTPEIYVLNSNFDILYHGRIDDSRREKNVESQDLRKALDEILAGKNVSKMETKAFGCSIKRITK